MSDSDSESVIPIPGRASDKSPCTVTVMATVRPEPQPGPRSSDAGHGGGAAPLGLRGAATREPGPPGAAQDDLVAWKGLAAPASSGAGGTCLPIRRRPPGLDRGKRLSGAALS